MCPENVQMSANAFRRYLFRAAFDATMLCNLDSSFFLLSSFVFFFFDSLFLLLLVFLVLLCQKETRDR